MFDIHCHILYGLDDGADSLDDSVKMISLAYEGGTRAIIATPHCNVPNSYRNYHSQLFNDRLAEISDRLARQKIDVALYPGQEVFCSGRLISMLREGKIITLNSSRYILVEFDFSENSASAYVKLEQLVSEGLVPVVAHPERYAFVCEEPDAAMRMKDIGCLLQVNKGSIKGAFGRPAFSAARHILNERLADFVASDGHSPYVRTPYLADAFEIVCDACSMDYAELLFEENPRAVINNEEIYPF